MRRLLFMLAALLWWGGAEAQDVILLRNADEVKAEVREITDSHILYTLWGGSDARRGVLGDVPKRRKGAFRR